MIAGKDRSPIHDHHNNTWKTQNREPGNCPQLRDKQPLSLVSPVRSILEETISSDPAKQETGVLRSQAPSSPSFLTAPP